MVPGCRGTPTRRNHVHFDRDTRRQRSLIDSDRLTFEARRGSARPEPRTIARAGQPALAVDRLERTNAKISAFNVRLSAARRKVRIAWYASGRFLS